MLAYLPQHVAQVITIAIGGTVVYVGAMMLAKGAPPEYPRMSPRLARLLGLVAIAVGVALGLVFFFVDAEPPDAPFRDHWGGLFGIAILAVFFAVFGWISYSNAKKDRRPPANPRRRR